jgi:hypothetical protein
MMHPLRTLLKNSILNSVTSQMDDHSGDLTSICIKHKRSLDLRQRLMNDECMHEGSVVSV